MKKSLTSRLYHCCFFEFSSDLSDFDFRFSQLAPRFEFLFSGRSGPGFLFLAPSHAAARPKRLLILFRCRLFFPCSEIFPPVVDLVVAFSLKHAEGNSVSRSAWFRFSWQSVAPRFPGSLFEFRSPHRALVLARRSLICNCRHLHFFCSPRA
jgi:hypothetical protein